MLLSRADLELEDHQFISPIRLLENIHIQSQNNNPSLSQFCLFLDIDGTISEFHNTPSQSFIAPDILENIKQLQQLKLPIIAVTGRSLKDALRLFHPIQLSIAGTHGLEIKLQHQTEILKPKLNFNFDIIDHEILMFKNRYPNIRLEEKLYSRAFHVREHPELGDVTEKFSQILCQKHPELKLHHGKFVYEIIFKDADKGQAIKEIYRTLKPNTYIPLFIGDDKTDESGFSSIQALNGYDIKVGNGPTQAQFRLQDVLHVAQFIQYFREYIQAKYTQKSPSIHVRKILCLN